MFLSIKVERCKSISVMGAVLGVTFTPGELPL